MKKILLLIIINIYVLVAQESNTKNTIVNVGTFKYSNLSTNLNTFYLSYMKDYRKDIILLEYRHLDFNNGISDKIGTISTLSYVFKLTYENNIIFGPKISYEKYDFDEYNNDYIKVGLYGEYRLNNKIAIYSNVVINDTILKKNNKDLNNIDIGLKYNKNRFIYNLNLETSASINIHNDKIIDIFSSNEYEKVLFSIGYKY